MKRKTIIITGCSSGFGYGTAIAMAKSGYTVFAGVRNLKSEGAKRLFKEANQKTLPITLVELDVDSDKSVENAMKKILIKTNRIDVLINNAGYGTRGPVEDFTIGEVKAQFETNVYGMLRMVKAITPIMRKQKSGLIINFSSISALVSFPLFGIYAASKLAVEGITESLWFELRHFGIDVTILQPGSFKTNFAGNRKDAGAIYTVLTPYKRLVGIFDARYKKTHANTTGVTSKQKGPEEVVSKIVEICETKNPKLRYRIGIDAHKNYWIRKMLPDFLWIKLLRKIYRW